MPISSTKRVWIAVAVLIGIAAAGVGAYLYRMQRPLDGLSAGTAPDIMSQLPPGAPVIAYIDVATLRKLQDSPLAAVLGLAGADPKQDAEYESFVRDTGFDYTRDLDKVGIAVWPASWLAPNQGMGENRVLTIGEGRFNQEKIKAYALRSGHTGTEGTQLVYTVPGEPPVSFAFLSSTRIALASGTGTEALLGNLKPSPPEAAMQTRINRVAGAPIFGVARTDTLPKNFYDNFKNAPQLESLARSIKGLTLAGQPQDNRIDMALDAESDSLTHATEIATLIDGLRMFGTVALSDPKSRRQMTKTQAAFLTALASQVKVTHQERWVRLTLALTPEMLGTEGSNHAQLR